MSAAVESDLRAGDRADAERLRRVRELERAVDAVVVGERERLVAELGGPRGELLGLRGAVEERIRRVAVELDVRSSSAEPIACAPGEGEAITDTPQARAAHPLRPRVAHRDLDALRAGERGADPHVHRSTPTPSTSSPASSPCRLGPELEDVDAPAGTLVLVPPGVVHGFDNDGPDELRFLNFHAPGGGFADYLRGRKRRLRPAPTRPTTAAGRRRTRS